MKLDYFALKSEILKIDAALPESSRWPNLQKVLDMAEDKMPMWSSAKNGSAIFLGWQFFNTKESSKYGEWFYHHSITLVYDDSPLSSYNPFGFHSNKSIDDVLNGTIVVNPVFNVGTIPESKLFAALLRKAGIKASVNSPAMSIVEKYERSNNNRYSRVL